jgi:hypothetical protein
MPVLLSNNAVSLLASSLNASATALTISLADADRFPSPTGGDWFPVTLFDNSGNTEILRCTSRTGAVLTVTRGQEGTAAVSWPTGSGVELRATAAAFNALAVANAGQVSTTPAGSLAATNVQAALNELDTEKAALAGATFTGGINATGSFGATWTVVGWVPSIKLNTGNVIQFDSGTAPKWGIGTSGDNLFFGRGADGTAGSAITYPLQLSNTAAVFSSTTLTVGGNQVWHAGNLTPGNYLPLAGGTMTGFLDGRTINGDQTASGPGATEGSIRVRSASGTGDAALARLTFLCTGSFGTGMHLRADGFFGVGGWSHAAWRWYFDSAGNMVAAGNVSAYSDERLKEDVQPIKDALAKITLLDGVTFVWNNRSTLIGEPGKADIGVIAQQVEKVFPEMVRASVDDPDTGEVYKTVSYSKLIPVLIEAIKELTARIEQLERDR